MVRTPYCPTPYPFVAEMLDRAQLRPGEALCDVGSGDGRIVRAAAALGAQACGIERDPELVRKSSALGLNIREGDLCDMDWSPFDVLTFFPESQETADEVAALFLTKAKPGARLVLFLFGGVQCRVK